MLVALPVTVDIRRNLTDSIIEFVIREPLSCAVRFIVLSVSQDDPLQFCRAMVVVCAASMNALYETHARG